MFFLKSCHYFQVTFKKISCRSYKKIVSK